MYTTFYGSTFFGGGFFGGTAIGGKGDNPASGRKLRNYPPTGLIDRPARPTVEQRVQDAAEIHAEVIAEQKFEREPEPVETFAPVSLMTLAEVEREIGVLIRKVERTDEEDMLLMILIAASA